MRSASDGPLAARLGGTDRALAVLGVLNPHSLLLANPLWTFLGTIWLPKRREGTSLSALSALAIAESQL